MLQIHMIKRLPASLKKTHLIEPWMSWQHPLHAQIYSLITLKYIYLTFQALSPHSPPSILQLPQP